MATDTHAIENAQAWLENIVSMVKRLEHVNDCNCDEDVTFSACVDAMAEGMSFDDYHDSDAALEAIQESPLSVEVRSGWVSLTDWGYLKRDASSIEAAEYKILLTTGGPALRIIGELDQYGEPETARLEYQDWGTPWTEYVPLTDKATPTLHSETYRDVAALDALLAYARSFYYGS